MRWFTVRTCAESFRPLYLASKCLLVHFSTYDHQANLHQRTVFDLVRLVLTTMSDVVLSCLYIQRSTIFLQLTDTILINAGLFGSVVLTVIVATTIPPWNTFMECQFYEWQKVTYDIDKKLAKMGLTVDYQRFHLLSTVSICLSMSAGVYVFIAVYGFPSYIEWLGLSQFFGSFWSVYAFARTFLILGFFTCYSSLLLVSLRERYVLLNGAIRDQLLTSRQQIRELATLQDLLGDSVELYNRCFALHSLFFLTSGLGYTLFTGFAVFHGLVASNDQITLQLALGNIAMDGFFFILIVLPAVLACRVNSECLRTVVFVHKTIFSGSRNRKILSELRSFSQQMWHTSTKVSCCLFDFKWSLFYEVVGALTMYFIILIQFDIANIKFK